MAIIVETGAVVSGANSYVSLDYCDTYCEDRGLTSWADGSDEAKEPAILRAMAYIEDKSFKGTKTDYLSPLRWPRMGVDDLDGYVIESNIIPDALKRAVAQAAYEEFSSSGCLMPNMKRTDFVASKTIGPISTTYVQGKYKPAFPMIDALLNGLVEDNNTLVRG